MKNKLFFPHRPFLKSLSVVEQLKADECAPKLLTPADLLATALLLGSQQNIVRS